MMSILNRGFVRRFAPLVLTAGLLVACETNGDDQGDKNQLACSGAGDVKTLIKALNTVTTSVISDEGTNADAEALNDGVSDLTDIATRASNTGALPDIDPAIRASCLAIAAQAHTTASFAPDAEDFHTARAFFLASAAVEACGAVAPNSQLSAPRACALAEAIRVLSPARQARDTLEANTTVSGDTLSEADWLSLTDSVIGYNNAITGWPDVFDTLARVATAPDDASLSPNPVIATAKRTACDATASMGNIETQTQNTPDALQQNRRAFRDAMNLALYDTAKAFDWTISEEAMTACHGSEGVSSRLCRQGTQYAVRTQCQAWTRWRAANSAG